MTAPIYCPKCKSKTGNGTESIVKTKNGRHQVRTNCKECGCCKTNFCKGKKGDGVVDSVLKATQGLPVGDIGHRLGLLGKQRFPEEAHTVLTNPKTGKKETASFAGPGTRLTERLDSDKKPKDWSKPVNMVDQAAYAHDLAYQSSKDPKVRSQSDLVLYLTAKEISESQSGGVKRDALKVRAAMLAKLRLEAPELLKQIE